MARKCSSCGNNGHNSRTCSGHGGRVLKENGGGGGGGVRLFGVQLHVGSSSSPMKKCFSMECLSSEAPPAYYAAAALNLAANSSSPSVSSSSSLVSVEETAEKMTTNGYLSDGLMGRAQERKKGVPWTEDEHRRFLAGLEKLGKGDWRGISRHFVTTRTPTQVASHAQKYFLRQSSLTQKKRRSSLFDVVENADRAASASERRLRLKDAATTSSAPDTELPPLSLGISRPAKPERVLPPSLSMSSLLPRCSAAMSTSTSPGLAAAPQRPSSSLTPSTKPHQASLQQAPDLELKISTADHQTAGSSPRTPFFGTIRVT
ncbi:Transcription factor DIVARICATA [Dichanthelium oligosanthes]|uniref:Transcription factor DIVARICATA n=1 Tax=Dichanthelium oligosanthes TaxID=888268 RepID=A0A1E5VFZ3_9POAL|nr:Transcription factor DIVARICATA [Dichanthelium oligosanthes]